MTAPRTVIASSTIHNLAVPRPLRCVEFGTAVSRSAEVAREADSFCQKSVLAIGGCMDLKFSAAVLSGTAGFNWQREQNKRRAKQLFELGAGQAAIRVRLHIG